ncbi:major facilitator superfamily domain-containing protein [Pisolithus orientalis]|uniref:major facilitator superfamily domain-containing protein n=1 Tax=Pisolithus orientalis TaxID=936130 RepID=UPI002224A0BC|nr:major facilitator superfamily domain-containing protein [Pisolithus orientalis]KAI6028698.1 major facilitator superfamily domain-containing protein [Pisolithus orientalis]
MDALDKPVCDDLSEQDSAVLERVVWRKLDIWVLPMCTALYLISFFDRSNIGNARVAGMQTALEISNYQYTVALTLTYVPYIAMELPSNLILKRVGPNLMLPTMVTLWGVVAVMQGLVTSYTGLLLCRFFLGLAEGGLFPGLVLYLSSFYPRERLQIRITAFFASASVTGAFSGLLAAAIMQMDGVGGKPGWSWIFILEGLFTFVFGIFSFLVLPRSPETARFLSSEERSYILSKLKSSRAISEDEGKDGFSWIEVLRAIRSPQVLMLCLIVFFGGSMLFGLAFFEPTIVAGLGYTGNRAQLMSVPPFVVAFFASVISAFVSDRYGCRGLTVIFFAISGIIGFSMFYATTSQRVQYASLFFSVTGAYASAPAAITWLANNSAPHIRRASSIAIGFVASNSGGILATWLLGSLSPAPEYTAATITFIAMSIGMVVVSSLNLFYLSRENRAKAETRLSMAKHDEPEHLGDRSAWFVYTL